MKMNTEEVETMSERECLALLRGTHLGRLGLVDRHVRPLIFPVNYVFDDGAVVFRTGKGSKLDLAPGSPVCFEIDGWSAGAGIGWSVLVKGTAHDVTEPRGMPTSRMRQLPVKPVAPGLRNHWIGIQAEEITGRRFSTEAHRRP
jgi:nitroimidazol reductase NimA-like FMN-containing flavoprotein (pyridoxamine 5'-phosphate oxidase superfamily)